MMRLLCALVATVGAASPARAEPDPDVWMPDGKEALAQIHERGIVLSAGKRNYIVVLPRVKAKTGTVDGTRLSDAGVWFGTASKLYFHGAPATNLLDGQESLWLATIPSAYANARVIRRGDKYVLSCEKNKDVREIELPRVGGADAARKVLPAPELVGRAFPYVPYLLAREEHGTSYYYVDRPYSRDADSLEFRLFVGKRGAMKRLPVKELSSDFETDVLVTAKGTLTINKQSKRPTGNTYPNAPAETVLFGTDKKRSQLKILDITPRQNFELIYLGLGIYPRDTEGLPCEVL